MSATATPLRRVGVVAAVVAVVVIAVAIWLLADSEEPGWSSDGITLNMSSWEPGDDANEGLIVGVVRVDRSGCVYLDTKWGRPVVNVVWPASYTASRQTDGTLTIFNPDGVAVAATGHPLRAGGGAAAGTDLACRAQGARGAGVLIQDELPPLND